MRKPKKNKYLYTCPQCGVPLDEAGFIGLRNAIDHLVQCGYRDAWHCLVRQLDGYKLAERLNLFGDVPQDPTQLDDLIEYPEEEVW